MEQIKKWGIWATFYILFVLDYYVLSNSEDKVQTCVFWVAIMAFMIWLELIRGRGYF